MSLTTILVIDARLPDRGCAIARAFSARDRDVFLCSGRDIQKIPEMARVRIPRKIDLVVMHNDDRGYWDDMTRDRESSTILTPIRYTGGDPSATNEEELWIRKRKVKDASCAPNESEVMEVLEW